MNGLSDLHLDDVCRWIGLAVDGEVVGQQPFHDHRRKGIAGLEGPFLKLQGVVEIGVRHAGRTAGVHDQGAVQAQTLLTVDGGVRMVEYQLRLKHVS